MQLCIFVTGKKSSKVELSNEELNEIIDHNKMEHQMELALGHLKQEYIEQLSLRTSSGTFCIQSF